MGGGKREFSMRIITVSQDFSDVIFPVMAQHGRYFPTGINKSLPLILHYITSDHCTLEQKRLFERDA